MASDPVRDLFKPRLFEQTNRSTRPGSRNVSLSDLSDRYFGSTGSFRFASPSDGLTSTQQVDLDYSKFENHTFFDSGVSKVNVAFDRLINHFPFDGSRKEIEQTINYSIIIITFIPLILSEVWREASKVLLLAVAFCF